ncbi:hypothetical protein, partial [Escherichia coli]|uniref:hypothetical protein n=1 Tax=Escherichia coli TaxID=562 RepID=UPI001BFC87DF
PNSLMVGIAVPLRVIDSSSRWQVDFDELATARLLPFRDLPADVAALAVLPGWLVCLTSQN